MQARVRPKGVVRSTLDVFEEFFGEELSDDMLRAIDGLPVSQAEVLWDRLRDHWLTMWDVLALRNPDNPPLYSMYGVTPEMREPYGYMPRREIITISDTEQNNPLDIAIRPALKHAALRILFTDRQDLLSECNNGNERSNKLLMGD